MAFNLNYIYEIFYLYLRYGSTMYKINFIIKPDILSCESTDNFRH